MTSCLTCWGKKVLFGIASSSVYTRSLFCFLGVNERMLRLADRRQVPEKCITEPKGEREYFSAPGFLLSGICWGVCCVPQRANGKPGTLSCLHQHVADGLRQVPSAPRTQLNRSSYRSAEASVLSCRRTAHTAHVGTSARPGGFSPLSGERALGSHVAWWMC